MKNDNQKPLNPTDDAQGMMGDVSGLTGISTDNNDNNTKVKKPDLPLTRIMSDQAKLSSDDKANENEVITTPLDQQPDISALTEEDASGNETLDHASPATSGEQSISGDMPDPASDNDTLANAQAVGMQLDEDTEHPQEIDIARDIDLAEEEIRQK